MLIFQQLTQIKTSNPASISMCMTAINEWSPLKKMVVGIADKARLPEVDDSLRYVFHSDQASWNDILTGPFDAQLIQEANDDLDVMVKHLQAEGVEVVRPNATDCDYYNFCPRDSVFHYADKTIATPMPIKARKGEWKAFGHHLENVIELNCSHSPLLYNPNCLGPNPNVLALNETEPAFDAANCLKANDHILYLVSNTGNMAGCNLLQDILGQDVTVHPLKNIYAFAHLDSTITLLREGLMLINPIRVKQPKDLPAPFDSWDHILCPEPVISYDKKFNFCSPWVFNMNLISVNEQLVIVEETQSELRKLLQQYGIESLGMPGRHMANLGGGPHCTSLDLIRD